MVFSGDSDREWKEFANNLPRGVYIKHWRDRPPQVYVPPATRLLLSEIIACAEEMSRATECLDLEVEGIAQIRHLVRPDKFAKLLRLSAAEDGEFLRHQALVKKWANPGAELQYQWLVERSNSLATDGWREFQSLQEPSAAGPTDWNGCNMWMR